MLQLVLDFIWSPSLGKSLSAKTQIPSARLNLRVSHDLGQTLIPLLNETERNACSLL